jgi:tetratricopeptide (TPR) repeat protein
MILRRTIALLAALWLGAHAPVAAASPDADWESGKSAFAAGDVASALVFFESARDQGQQGPAVHYNIAVCQYELGDYVAARDTFRHVAVNFPALLGLAEYNVGLAEQRLGNTVAAQRQFINAYRHSDDKTVKALAASQLRDIDQDASPGWHGTVAMQVGFDDNIALRDSLGLPAGQTGESPMADLFASLNAPLPGDVGLSFDTSFYAITYTDENDYDQAELRLGLRHRASPGDWRLDSGLYATGGTLGGDRFNDEANAEFRATRYLGDEASFELRLRYDDVRGATPIYSGIDGSRSRVDLGYRWFRVPHYLVVQVGIENNSRTDPGASASRQRLRTMYIYQLNDRWEIETSLSLRSSDFDDLAEPRGEDLAYIAVGASYRPDDNWLVSARYQYSDNDSSDPVFTYRRNQFTIGFRRLF